MTRLYYPGSGAWVSDRWTFDGMRTLILENEWLRVVVLVDKGTDIVEFRYKPANLDYLLALPDGPRDPRRDTPSAYGDSPFLDYFSGGWNEILPNGGPFAAYRGAGLGQHGEISLIPWEYAILEQSPERVVARCWVEALRTPLRVEKTLTLRADDSRLFIDEVLTNRGGETIDCMWGQHIAFGRPFLDEGAVIDLPECRLIAHPTIPGYEPRRFRPGVESAVDAVPAPDPAAPNVDAREIPPFGALQAQEMAYLAELRDGWYAITSPARGVGFGLRFDHTLYKYVWYWQQLGHVARGYPWWGRLHCTALEPWTSYPTGGLNEAVANGTALRLTAGETVRHRLIAIAYASAGRVRGIGPDGDITFV
jgi:hypothetical protein